MECDRSLLQHFSIVSGGLPSEVVMADTSNLDSRFFRSHSQPATFFDSPDSPLSSPSRETPSQMPRSGVNWPPAFDPQHLSFGPQPSPSNGLQPTLHHPPSSIISLFAPVHFLLLFSLSQLPVNLPHNSPRRCYYHVPHNAIRQPRLFSLKVQPPSLSPAYLASSN